MRGQKNKEKKKRTKHDERLKVIEHNIPMRLTMLDLFPINPTKENVFKYLVDSQWIDAICVKNMGMENDLLDDIIQELYLTLWNKMDRLIEVYETRGILAFCGYVKVVCDVQSRYPINMQNRICGRIKTVFMDYQMMSDIDTQYNPDIDEIYHMKNTVLEYD